MRLIWEVADIVGGVQVRFPLRAETHVIAYVVNPTAGPNEYTLVSLDDGNMTPPCAKTTLAELLTTEGAWPVKLLEKLP